MAASRRSARLRLSSTLIDCLREVCEGKTLHLARTFAPAGAECEGQDLNPWTSTGAELESAAVSRLGYPRTRFPVGTAGAKTLRTTATSEDGDSGELLYKQENAETDAQ